MNELQIFNNPEFGDVRTITEDGVTLFCGSDVAKALGYKRPNDAITAHCKGTVKRRIGVQTGTKADGSPATQQIEMLFIPEGDIYRLAARSELLGADAFERWIFDEVLPTIRRTGSYAPQDAAVQALERVAGCMEAMMGQFAVLSRKVDALERRQETPSPVLPPPTPAETPPGFMDSMEVARILGRQHNNVLKGIRTVVERARWGGVPIDGHFILCQREHWNKLPCPYYRLDETAVSMFSQNLKDWTLAEKLRTAFRSEKGGKHV